MIEFLLEHGADRNVKDTKVGSTAAGWAEYGKHPELLDLLSTALVNRITGLGMIYT